MNPYLILTNSTTLMKRFVLLLSMCALMSTFSSMFAQTVIVDFEDAATTTTFLYFGSGIEGQFGNIIANPDQSGANMSDSVAEHIRPANSETFAGAISDPSPQTAIDLTTPGKEICVTVWSPVADIKFLFKLEGGAMDPSNGDYEWEQSDSITVASQWVELCFDPRVASENGNGVVADGDSWANPVIFFDFDQSRMEEFTYYFDNIVVADTGMATSIRGINSSIFEVTNTLVTDKAQLTFTSSLPKEVRILNAAGQQLRHVTTAETEYQLDFAGLSAGMYLIEVNSAGLRAIQRVIKQ